MKKILLLGGTAAWIFFLTPLMAATPNTQEKNNFLELSEESYHKGDYRECIMIVEKLLNEYRLQTRAEIIQAHTILGAAYFNSGNTEKATHHFDSLLNFDRQIELNPNDYSPKINDFLNRLRQSKWNIPSTTAAPPKDLLSNNLNPNPTNSTSPKEPFKLNSIADEEQQTPLSYRFIPFGVGQFYNNEPVKGRFYLGSESLLLAIALTTFSLFQSEQAENGGFNDPDSASNYRNAFSISLITFGAIAVGGIIDALVVQHQQQSMQEAH